MKEEGREEFVIYVKTFSEQDQPQEDAKIPARGSRGRLEAY